MHILSNNLLRVASAARTSMAENRVPGLAMAFVSKGEVLLRETVGLQDAKKGIPVTEETYFEAASLTKAVFSYLVKQLSEGGVIDLDAPLVSYGMPAPSDDPRFFAATAKHVLSHGTGLPNWGKLPLALSFAPGEGYSYSGSGYQYLQQTVEKLTGIRLDELLQRHVFDPLGMERAAMIWTPAMRHTLAATWDEEGQQEPPRTTACHTSGMEPNAAYSLYVTAADYIKFVGHLAADAETAKWISQVQNSAAPGVMWGLGWGMTDGCFWHWGDNGGFKSFTGFDPVSGDAFVIHTNGSNGLRVCFDVIAAATDLDTAPINRMIKTVD